MISIKRKVFGRKITLGVLFVVLTYSTSGVGGDFTSSWNDGSNANGDSSLCRIVRNAKRSLLKSFVEQYTASNPLCDLTNHCTNVSCSADFSRDKVEGGLVLRLCQDDPEVNYRVNIPHQWDQPWSHTFSSKNFNGKEQRWEIFWNQNNTTSPQTRPTKWFIKVIFSITGGRNNFNHDIKYISVNSVLQICLSASEDSCRNTTLYDFPRLPQHQICDFTEVQGGPGNRNREFVSSSRSSRNANAFNPEELHRQAAERTLKGVIIETKPGDLCNSESIFSCGHGASCVVGSNGNGVCECLPTFMINSTTKTCVIRPHVTPSDDPSSADSLNSRSYSSAVGAIVSILVLLGIAAGVYFGTKYHYFTRLRHRIPVLRCWPFRRNQPWEDNVTMVNPLGPQEDDDPPLL